MQQTSHAPICSCVYHGPCMFVTHMIPVAHKPWWLTHDATLHCSCSPSMRSPSCIHEFLSVAQWIKANIEVDLSIGLPRDAEELLKVLQPSPPVRIPVPKSHFDYLINRFASLDEYLVPAECNPLTTQFASFIVSHLSKEGRTEVLYVTIFCAAGLCYHLPCYSHIYELSP